MKRLLLLFLLAIPFSSMADIDHVGNLDDDGVHLMWWPIVDPPAGWHHDDVSSRQNAVNAFVPDGETFADSPTVMYAKAEYKPRATHDSLQALIEDDIADFAQVDPPARASRPAPMRIGDGFALQVVDFAPADGVHGNWERIAYAEDGDYFLTFAVSARSAKARDTALDAFAAMVGSYHPGNANEPAPSPSLK